MILSPIPLAQDRPTVTVTEAAAILGIGRSAAYNAVKTGELPSMRVGGRVVVPTALLRRMLHLDDAPPAA